MAGGRVLSASYILDSAALGPGIAAADAELAGLDDSTRDLSDKVDGHTAAMGAAFNDLGAGIGADVGAGVEDAKGKFKDLDDAGSDLESDFDKHTSRIGSGFKSLGESLGGFGLPFSSSLTKMGENLDTAKSKGQGFKQVMSDIGGATLAVGAVGLAAVSVEAIKMADEFDVAQSQLQVAVKNSGESFKAVKPSIDATYASMANLGFNSTEVAGALTSLVTSTGNTEKSEQDLSIAADLARAKHISLSDATGILTKTLAGSTRGMTALGLNLDVGSGKLKTIATDTTALQTAQGKLHLVNEQVSDGILKGAAAYSALLAAHDAVSKSSEKLSLDQGTISKILDTVKEKTQGAAAAYGNTLAGQMAIAGAQVHNLGTSFGEMLIPKITEALSVVTKSVEWFQKHKVVAEALAITIGTVLAGAVAVFAVNTGAKMVSSVQDAGKALSGMASKITTYIAGLGEAEGAEEGFAATSEETGAASSAAFGPIGLAIMGLVVVGELVVTHWKQVSGFLKDAWHDIESTAKTVWGDVTDFFKKWGEDLLLVFAPVIGIPLFLATHWNEVLSDAKEIWGEVIAFFSTIPNKIIGFFTGAGSWLLNVGKDIWTGFITGLTASLTAVGTWFGELGSKVLGFIVNADGWLLDVGVHVWNGMISGLTTALSTLSAWLGELGPKVLDFIIGPDLWLLSIGAKIWNGMVSGLSSSLNTVASWFGSLGSTVEGYLSDAGTWLVDVGEAIIDGIVNGLKSAAHKVTDFLGGLVNDIKSIPVIGGLIGSPSPYFTEVGVAIGDGFVNGLTGSTAKINSSMTEAMKGVTGVTVPPVRAASGPNAAADIMASPPGPAGPAAANTAAGPVTVEVTVQGNVLDGRQLVDLIWQGLLQKGLVNGSSGQLVLAT